MQVDILPTSAVLLQDGGLPEVSVADMTLLAGPIHASMPYQVCSIDVSANHVNPLLFSCIQFLTAGILGITSGGIFGTVTLEGITACALPIVYCGVFSAGVAYTCQLLGQKNGNPTVCALFCSMEALFAVIAECIIEQHLPTWKIVLGCVLMLIAVVLSQLPQDIFKKKKTG
jgi:drug/metabolite transporter (DMT)-like permease